jgi:hypothetical protein
MYHSTHSIQVAWKASSNGHLLWVNSIHRKARLTTHQTTAAQGGQTLRLPSVRVSPRGRHVIDIVPGPPSLQFATCHLFRKVSASWENSSGNTDRDLVSHLFKGFTSTISSPCLVLVALEYVRYLFGQNWQRFSICEDKISLDKIRKIVLLPSYRILDTWYIYLVLFGVEGKSFFFFN